MRLGRGALLLSIVGLLAACGPTRLDQPGGFGHSDSPASAIVATSGAAPDLGPVPADGRGECAGVVPADTRLTGHLTAPDDVSTATVCAESTQLLAGKGEWVVRRIATLRGAQLAHLVEVLRVPSVTLATDAVCPAIGYLSPIWFVTLADGRHVQPAIPTQGCGPSQEALAALIDTPKDPSADATPLRQVRAPDEVASQCPDGLKDIVWREAQHQAGVAPPAPTNASVVSVCVSGRDPNDTSTDTGTGDVAYVLRLARTGLTTGAKAAVRAAFETLDARPWPPCPTRTPASMLALLVDPGSEGPNVSFYAEIGGCGRVLDNNLNEIGTLDESVISAVAALATHPVVPR